MERNIKKIKNKNSGITTIVNTLDNELIRQYRTKHLVMGDLELDIEEDLNEIDIIELMLLHKVCEIKTKNYNDFKNKNL